MLSSIHRYPVKGFGDESLTSAVLTKGRHMAWDRTWAVAHGKADLEDGGWVSANNFLSQRGVAELVRVGVVWREDEGLLELSHPALGAQTLHPAEDAALNDWLAPLADPVRPGPYRLVRASHPLTDFAHTHISIGSLSSLRALEEMAGRKLGLLRFRMNLWIDGLAPWEEFDWIDREIAIGPVHMRVIERDKRCNATNADPETGTSNTDLTRVLYDRFGHMDFGVYAQVTESGEVRVGDPVTA